MSHITINRVILVGRLTRDPELRALPSGSSVCSLRIACNSARRDGEGEYRDVPNYFSVSIFGGAGENVHRYMRKGRMVGIDGRLQWREWESDDQNHHEAVEVIADSVQFLDAPKGSSPEDGEVGGDESGPDGRELDVADLDREDALVF